MHPGAPRCTPVLHPGDTCCTPLCQAFRRHCRQQSGLTACPLLRLQMPSARVASCPCPNEPLPCACRRQRSRRVSHGRRVQACGSAPQLSAWIAGCHALHALSAIGGSDGSSVQSLTAASPFSPHPTPPHFAAPAAPGPASPCEAVPDALLGSACSPNGQRDDSSSSEEGAHADAAQCSDVVPLLAAGSGRLATGLRWRQGHQEAG